MRLKLINKNAKRFAEKPNDGIGRIAVVNAETGEELRWVTSVTLTADLTTEFRPVATIKVEVDLDVDVFALVEATKTIA